MLAFAGGVAAGADLFEGWVVDEVAALVAEDKAVVGLDG